MLLADLGADVIKVEDPTRGDDTRQWGPPWFGEGESRQSAYFLSVNRNKRSLTLNLKSEDGRAIARQLAAQSQIVIENFKPGHMASFGLSYDDLAALNPALIYCSISGFGQTGPYRDRPGYDYIVQAMSGLMSITGPVEGEPYKVGVAVSDVFAGLFATSSILAALRHAEHTGRGQYVDISLFDTQIAALVNVASSALVSGETAKRYGNEHANIVPYQTFRASDGDFVLATGNDRQFAQVCVLIGRPNLAEDPRYATNPARVANRETLIPEMQAAFAHRPAAEWVEGLLALGVPAGTINDVAAALNDPQVQARGLIREILIEPDEALRLVGPAFQLSETPAQVRLPPPRHGQHTDEVLRETLGMSDAEIARCREMQII